MRKQILTLLLSLTAMVSFAEEVEVNGLRYEIIKKVFQAKVAEPLEGNTYQGDIVIPEKIEYNDTVYDVVGIKGTAFQYSRITSIKIPESITEIPNYCFESIWTLTSVSLPSKISKIPNYGFHACHALKTINIPQGVLSIGDLAFSDCEKLDEIELPNGLQSIGFDAFHKCESLQSIVIPNSVTYIGHDAFSGCTNLSSLELSNQVKTIASRTFNGCVSLKSLNIPNSVETIEYGAFMSCKSLTSITIPNGITKIEQYAFNGCTSASTITISNSVTQLEGGCFSYCIELKDVYCYAEKIPTTSNNCFENSYIEYVTLHVPSNSIDLYMASGPWKNFKSIVGLDGTIPQTSKCATPTINYQNGKLQFNCDTEGAEFVADITDDDIKQYNTSSISLTATYNISVFAMKSGYDNSDVVTATLCWIDADPKTEGVTNGVANVRANPVLIQSDGNVLSISGVDAGTPISVFDVSGKQVGSATATSESTSINTNLTKGQIGIVKIGEKTIKIVVR